ncbi:MAG TPA: hypothetical protein VIY48_07080 [Candidatus Paceibacterota bacterium]
MSGIFGPNPADKAQKQQNRLVKNTQNRLDNLSNVQDIVNPMQNLADKIGSQGITPLSFSTPGYGITVNNNGGSLTRTPGTQGWMDALKSGLGTDEAGYNTLLSQIAPGFGLLTQSRLADINNQATAALGNLKSQLAKRRVLGASFADSQLTGLKAQYDQMRQQALAESITQEMQMTQDALKQRTDARNATISQALSQIQFEGNLGGQLTGQVLSSMNDLSKLQADLLQSAAQLQVQAKVANMQGTTGLNQQAIGNLPDLAAITADWQSAPYKLAAGVVGNAVGSGGLFGQSGSTAAAPAAT